MIQKEIDKFLKCDLHMHSCTDYSRNYTKKEFITKLEESKLDVIALTDHNIIDINLYKEIVDNKKITSKVIAGCELNLSLSDTEIKKNKLKVKSDFYHGIILFDISNIEILWDSLKKYITDHNSDINDIDNINLTDLSKKLKNFSFKLDILQPYIGNVNYYLLFHENKGDRNLSDYLDNTCDENIKYKHKLFYYNNNLGLDGSKRNKKITSYFDESLRTTVASFLFSDAKNIDEIGEKYSWINFSGSFSDLILAISDPDTRIFTSENIKITPQSNELDCLESIRFTSFKIDSEGKEIDNNIELFFNPGMNGIIGSRGSGKTMLGNILAKKDLSKYKDYIKIDSIQYKLKDSEYSTQVPNCKYLQQNTLLEIYENGNYMTLDFIKNYYSEILNKKEELIKNNIQKIKAILESEKKLITDFILNNNTIKSSDFLGTKPRSENLLHNLDNILFPNNLEEIQKIKESSATFKECLDNIDLYLKSLCITPKYPEVEEISSLLKQYKEEIFKNLEQIKELKTIFYTQLDSCDLTAINKRHKYIDKIKNKIDDLNTLENNQAKVFDDKYKELVLYCKELYRVNKTVYENKKKIEELYMQIFADDISKTLTMDNGEEIAISTNIVKEKEYNDIVMEQLKNFSNYSEFITKLIINSNEISLIKDMFNGQKYRGLTSVNEYIDKFYKNVSDSFSNFQNIQLIINYKGKELSKYSPGKRAEILLEIFLQEDNISNSNYKYIILDQPEDNLDTNTIIKKLVNKLRKLKLSKQLFIISHSAPVIVNGDSDLVIYSEEQDSLITYKSGRMNNSSIREDIVNVLDGGEKNLKMRLNKYDFSYEEE